MGLGIRLFYCTIHIKTGRGWIPN